MQLSHRLDHRAGGRLAAKNPAEVPTGCSRAGMAFVAAAGAAQWHPDSYRHTAGSAAYFVASNHLGRLAPLSIHVACRTQDTEQHVADLARAGV